MLSQSTILAQQKILGSWLTTLGTIYTQQRVNDGYGTMTPNFVPRGPMIHMKIQSATRVPKAGADPKQLSVLTDWRIVVPVGTVAVIGDRVYIQSRVFEIEDVDNLSPDMASVILFCYDVER